MNCTISAEINAERKGRGGLRAREREREMDRFGVSLLNNCSVESFKKKYDIRFIIWVTTLSYNEMLINWPLFH